MRLKQSTPLAAKRGGYRPPIQRPAALAKSTDKALNVLTNTEAMKEILRAALSPVKGDGL